MKLQYIFHYHRILGAIGVLLLITACLGARPSELPAVPLEAIPAPTQAPTLRPYYVQIGDVLDIKLLLNQELNDQVTVRPDGRISTVIAQDVLAYNRTPLQIQNHLNYIYKKHLESPQVAVIVRSFAPTRVYVTGEVNSPGEFISVGPTLTLAQAIARAGGMRNSANLEEIVILRHHNMHKPKAYHADYHAAVTGNNPTADVRLEPFDVVYVPRHGAGNAFLNYEQYLKQFVSPNVGVSYNINPLVDND